MVTGTPRDPRIDVIASALQPYSWERLSAEMLARYVVALVDRHSLNEQLAAICDPPEAPEAVEPADRDDDRVSAVAQALGACDWRSLTLAAVSVQALRALDAWWDRRRWLEIELSWLLDESA